jgi:serine protease Do
MFDQRGASILIAAHVELRRWLVLFTLVAAQLTGWRGYSQIPSRRAPITSNDKTVLQELSRSFEELSQQSGRSVVQIFSKSYITGEDSGSDGELLTTENSSGSGVIMSADGYILTNGHVVRGGRQVRVKLSKSIGSEMRARRGELKGTVVGVDRETDLAVVKIDRADLPYLTFGDSDQLKQGQLVLALGNPLGLDHSVSLGVVSAVSRQIKPDDSMVYIQTDAPINPGNSGGPLVDADGRVVGINTLILTQSGGNEGIGFAIPSNVAEQIFVQLKTHGHVHRSSLGLIGETVDVQMAEGLDLPVDHGVIVSDMESNGPARSAGVRRDDVIVAVDGKAVQNVRQLEVYVYRQPVGHRVTLHIRRGTDEMDVPVEAAAKIDKFDALTDTLDPVDNLVQQLGIIGVDITKDVLQVVPDLDRPSGVLVAARNSNVGYSGPALKVGDAIYEVNRRVVGTVAELRGALSELESGDAVVLLIERDGNLIYVPLELD